VGLKHDNIDDPDMIGLQSSDGILFKIRLQDALDFKTLAVLIEDLGGNDFIPLPNIDGDTVRLLFTMKRDYYNVRGMLNAKTADEILKLVFALVYLDNSSLLFAFLGRNRNFMQMLLDNSNGRWFALLKDILPLVFVSTSDNWQKTRVFELFQKLSKEQVLMRDACLHVWKIKKIDKKDLLVFFAERQGDLSVVRYLVEEENVNSDLILAIAVNKENRPLFNYVLSNKKLLTELAVAYAIEKADSVTFLDDLLRAVAGKGAVVLLSLIVNANRFKAAKKNNGGDPLLLFYLIKQLVATNAADKFEAGRKCLANSFYVACERGWIDIVKFILSLKQPIFAANRIFYSSSSQVVKNEECLVAILQDDRFRLSHELFWETILKSEMLTQIVFQSSLLLLKEQAVTIINEAIESTIFFQKDLQTWQILYRFYPEYLQRFKPSQLFMVQNLDVAVFFFENVK
jgi:hypothetical protein